MPGIDVNQLGIVARSVANAAITQDGRAPIPNPRFGRYMEQYNLGLVPTKHLLADEGSYFTVNNAQTAIVTAAAPTTFSAVNPFLLIWNGDTSGATGKRVYLDYAMLLTTVAGATATSIQFAVTLDNGNRYTSGGTNLTNLVASPNNDVAAAKSIVQVYAGNITASAATAAARTVVGNRWMKGAIGVAGDQYTVQFGGVDSPTFLGTSTVTFSLNNCPPIVIGPNQSALIHYWAPAQTVAAQFIPEFAWWER